MGLAPHRGGNDASERRQKNCLDGDDCADVTKFLRRVLPADLVVCSPRQLPSRGGPVEEARSLGKIFGEGTVQIFGRIEGELRALTVLINEGAQVDGDVLAEDLTISGQVKGTIHASRVKLNSTAVVEGDIFHRSLSIEENARFEGSSKREDNAVDVPRAPLRRSAPQDDFQTQVTAIVQSNGKSNGALDHDEQPSAGAS